VKKMSVLEGVTRDGERCHYENSLLEVELRQSAAVDTTRMPETDSTTTDRLVTVHYDHPLPPVDSITFVSLDTIDIDSYLDFETSTTTSTTSLNNNGNKDDQIEHESKKSSTSSSSGWKFTWFGIGLSTVAATLLLFLPLN
jgi:hypothetical protein